MTHTLESLTSPAVIAVIQLAGLVAARLLPIVAFTPLFGGQALPARFRFGATLAITLGFMPFMGSTGQAAMPTPWYMFLLIKEGVVGLVLGLCVLVVFEAVAAGAALIDVSRGGVLAMLSDPQSQQRPALSLFFLKLTVVLFLTVGGHRVLFEALADSFAVVPIWEPVPRQLLGPGAATTVIAWTGMLLVIAVRMAAPVLIVVLIVDVAMGLIGRVAPQFDAHFVGLSIKSLLVALVLLLTLPLIMDLLNGEMAGLLTTMRHLLSL